MNAAYTETDGWRCFGTGASSTAWTSQGSGFLPHVRAVPLGFIGLILAGSSSPCPYQGQQCKYRQKKSFKNLLCKEVRQKSGRGQNLKPREEQGILMLPRGPGSRAAARPGAPHPAQLCCPCLWDKSIAQFQGRSPTWTDPGVPDRATRPLMMFYTRWQICLKIVFQYCQVFEAPSVPPAA